MALCRRSLDDVCRRDVRSGFWQPFIAYVPDVLDLVVVLTSFVPEHCES